MNAITPAKPTPEPKRMAASGMFPIEPMKVKKAASGPIRVWSTVCQAAGPPSAALPTKRPWKKAGGTKAAMTPATVNPKVTSFQTILHSMR